MKEHCRRIATQAFSTALIVFAIAVLAPMTVRADQNTEKLPAKVRWVLNDVGHLIDKKDYAAAVKRLLEFQSRGGPAPESASTPPNAYHHPIIYFALGNCRLYQERYDQAEAALATAVRLQPDLVAAWLNLAKVFYEQEKFVEAAAHFKEAYERSPDKRAEHLYYSAASLLTAQRYKAAIAVFERLFAAHPDRIETPWKVHWVHALLADNQARRALPYIGALIAEHSGKERIRWQEILLYQYVQLKMTAKARTYARALTRETPSEARWWKMFCQLELTAGEYTTALAALTIYGYLKPLTDEEKRLWADLNLQLEIPGQAAPLYEEMLATAPNPQILKNLVLAYRRLDRPEAALAQLANVPRIGKDPELMMLKGDLLYEMKRYAEASAAYRCAACEKHSRTGKAWLMAGYAAWQAKDIDASRQAFERAADFKQQRRSALLAMRQLQKVN